MGVHMPPLRDADRGIPKGGVAPINSRESPGAGQPPHNYKSATNIWRSV